MEGYSRKQNRVAFHWYIDRHELKKDLKGEIIMKVLEARNIKKY